MIKTLIDFEEEYIMINDIKHLLVESDDQEMIPYNEEQIIRSLKEVKESAEFYEAKIWYNSHMVMKNQLEMGDIKVDPTTWKKELQKAKNIRDKYGEYNLHISDQFDLGINYGKNFCLKWVQGL